jgi:hypothetical protein
MLRGHEKKIAALEEEREEEIKQRENDAEKAVNEKTEWVGFRRVHSLCQRG